MPQAETHYFLNQFNTGLKVKTEIDESPSDSFPFVLFLFKNEHVMVEELLQSFVYKVNP